jgi:exodeoxyribonuclease V beta subunit
VTDTFDVCGDLPTGTTVLEASAGTGKTFTIAALATRYVAEGRAELRDLMLVTFGRAATQELRERVRERLVATERILADPVAARASTGPPRGVAGVGRRRGGRPAAQPPHVRAGRLRRGDHHHHARLLPADADRLGVEGDLEPEATFVESIDDVVVEVVDDLYLRKFGRPTSDPPLLTYDDALGTVRRAIYDPQADLEPEDAEPDSLAGLRFGIAGPPARRSPGASVSAGCSTTTTW